MRIFNYVALVTCLLMAGSSLSATSIWNEGDSGPGTFSASIIVDGAPLLSPNPGGTIVTDPPDYLMIGNGLTGVEVNSGSGIGFEPVANSFMLTGETGTNGIILIGSPEPASLLLVAGGLLLLGMRQRARRP